MKLSEKLFLWFSTMIAVMLAVILILAGLQKQGIFDVGMLFYFVSGFFVLTVRFLDFRNDDLMNPVQEIFGFRAVVTLKEFVNVACIHETQRLFAIFVFLDIIAETPQ